MKVSYKVSFIRGLKNAFIPILVGLLAIILITVLGKGAISYFQFTHKMQAFISVFVLIPLSVCAYFSVLQFFKFSDLSIMKFWKSNNEMHD